MTDFPVEAESVAAQPDAPTRPMFWSVRREIWENRSIVIAPVAVAGIFLFGFLLSMFTMPRRMQAALAMNPIQQRQLVETGYDMVAGMILIASAIVGVFYCLDALLSERRDRSILFWKSLPVSDTTTVLAKMSIPLVILPAYSFIVIVVTQVLMLFFNTLALLGDSRTVAILWTRLPFIQLPIGLLYALVAIALWHAPIYAYLLLLSAWVRRAAFVWAFLPLFAIYAFETITFHTKHFAQFVTWRLYGWFQLSFVQQEHRDPLASLTPGRFLAAPGLWIGLAFAVAFIAGAIRLRRNREPI